MTAKEALDAGNDAESGDCLRRYEAMCGQRGACQRELLWARALDVVPDWLTLYDDYGKAVNRIPEIQ